MVNVAVVFNAGEQESEVRYHCEFAFLVGHYVEYRVVAIGQTV